MHRLLDGKVALITGAGRGIGRAAAELFTAHGGRVALTDIDEEPLAETADAVRAAGGRALTFAGDVTDRCFPDRVVDAVVAEFGQIDILVNNAGFTWDAALHKMTDRQWQAVLDVHLTAPFRMLRAASTYLRNTAKQEIERDGRARPRKIVNVSSTSATRGNAGQANYAAAKAGLIGLTKTIAREWGRFNVQANAVAFGWIDTRLTAEREQAVSIVRDGESIALGIPRARRSQAATAIPLGRPGTAAEAAGALLFLVSPLSDFVSGQILEVNGGA